MIFIKTLKMMLKVLDMNKIDHHLKEKTKSNWINE